jgi:hypothetical protein
LFFCGKKIKNLFDEYSSGNLSIPFTIKSIVLIGIDCFVSMKSNLQQFVQKKFLRWLMSTVILFYVLVPQVGACHCSGCRCKENSTAKPITKTITATIEESTELTCCSQNQKKSETLVSIADVSTNTLLIKIIKIIKITEITKSKSCCARMPVNRVSHGPNDHNQESPVCPCSLKQDPDQPNFILPSSILLRQNLDELLIDGSFLYSFSVSTIPVVKIVSFYLLYESPISRLPVRLHLLLLVLLN